MKKKIWIHRPNQHRGPGMVARNLIKGLAEIELDREIEIVNKPNIADYLGCLQHPGTLAGFMPDHALMGPNLFVLPQEEPGLVSKFKNFVVPSQWVKDKYQRVPTMQNKRIDIWSVGIDTHEWHNPESVVNQMVSKDFFVYCKGGRDKEAVEVEEKIVSRFGYNSLGILKYGSYVEEDLFNLTRKAAFAVLVTGTESQGIAYMNILASNVPCFVLNKAQWNYERDPRISAPATSVPYFNYECGEVENAFDDETFENFLENVKAIVYTPREYISREHSLKTSANRYVDLLIQTQEK